MAVEAARGCGWRKVGGLYLCSPPGIHVQCDRLPYDLKVCPWDAIEMVPTEEVAQVVAQIGGPPEYVEANWDRLVNTAQRLAELKAAAG